MSDGDTNPRVPAEGGLGAPMRHPIPWHDADWWDPAKLDDELRRVFDICHGCRRCFNLCDSFPRLFDLIDATDAGEVEAVASTDFKSVADACTLCDMCFMTKCPYVPPHPFNLDFPHLMLRYRAVESKAGKVPFTARQLTETDRNGALAKLAPGLVNWASARDNSLTRGMLENVASVDRRAELPKFHGRTFTTRARDEVPAANSAAPGFGREAVIYATCFVNWNNPEIGVLARRVLAHLGVATEVAYPRCCGMPQLEQGNVAKVAEAAAEVARTLRPAVDAGRAIVALVPSCALMLKSEWPLICPDNDDVKALAAATRDISEYIVGIARKEGLPAIGSLPGPVTLHLACHGRAQNFGQKAAEMLRLAADADVKVIERCSGHGGSWGVMKDNFDTAIKVGRPVARQALQAARPYVVSECPLAAEHILQGMEIAAAATKDGEKPSVPARSWHPVELLAAAFGLNDRT